MPGQRLSMAANRASGHFSAPVMTKRRLLSCSSTAARTMPPRKVGVPTRRVAP